MNTEPSVEQVITDLQEARKSHALWAEFLSKGVACQDCRSHSQHVGDIDHHEQWVKKYDHAIRLLVQLRDWRDAYFNMRQFAEANGLDVTFYPQ